MTRQRYLFIAASSAAVLAGPAAASAESGLVRHDLDERTALWTDVGRPALAVPGPGFIVGAIHQTGGAAADMASPDQFPVGAAARDEFLLRRCWGGYVAFAADGGARSVVRAPLGDLACYYARTPAGLAVASDISMFGLTGLPRPTVDWSELIQHLAASDLMRPATCLTGIAELMGGSRLLVDGDTFRVEALWSPWQWAASQHQVYDEDEAIELVRRAIVAAVACQTRDRARPLLKLSGGLDSSIVAAALAHAGADFECVNLVTDDPTGDERHYARLAAAAVGRTAIERLRETRFVDFNRSAAAALPRPSARAFTQASSAVVDQIAADIGAEAVLDGGGGDNVFCSLQSVRPVVDCLRERHGRTRLRTTTVAVAALAQVSTWTVLRKAWVARWRGRVRYPWPPDTSFLSPLAEAVVSTAVLHPWFEVPAGALPGKAAHVALVTQAQSVVEGFDATAAVPTYSPLLAQPVVEACLRVPSWLWFSGSLNRSVARRAFADRLPAAITDRPSKGSPDGFIAALYEANRSLIRIMLIDGELAAHGLIDGPALQDRLDDPRPVTGHAHLRILQLVDAEAWARGWA